MFQKFLQFIGHQYLIWSYRRRTHNEQFNYDANRSAWDQEFAWREEYRSHVPQD
jgi:hypothetical protein